MPAPLWRADWNAGLAGWIGASKWAIIGGMLTSRGEGGSLVAPLTPPSGGCAVEIAMRATKIPHYCNNGVGIRARVGQNNSPFIATFDNRCSRHRETSPEEAVLMGVSRGTLASRALDFGLDWHTFRLEVKGNEAWLLRRRCRRAARRFDSRARRPTLPIIIIGARSPQPRLMLLKRSAVDSRSVSLLATGVPHTSETAAPRG